MKWFTNNYIELYKLYCFVIAIRIIMYLHMAQTLVSNNDMYAYIYYEWQDQFTYVQLFVEDEEEGYFGQEQVPLTDEIREILEEYPDGQIFKVRWVYLKLLS